MTEAEWLSSDDPAAMLRLVEQTRDEGMVIAIPRKPSFRVSDRRLRLFACACCRGQMQTISPNAVSSIEVAERFADTGDISDTEREKHGNWTCTPEGLQSMLRFVVGHGKADHAMQADLLRCIFGNPWRPIEPLYHTLKGEVQYSDSGCTRLGTDPDVVFPISPWLTWNDGIVRRLAQAAYDERPGRVCPDCRSGWLPRRASRLSAERCGSCRGTGRINDGTLDPARLTILADALLEAGYIEPSIGKRTKREVIELRATKAMIGCCNRFADYLPCDCLEQATDEGLVAHLRSPGPHVRGCWVIDLLLARK